MAVKILTSSLRRQGPHGSFMHNLHPYFTSVNATAHDDAMISPSASVSDDLNKLVDCVLVTRLAFNNIAPVHVYKSCCCSSPLHSPLKCVESFIKQSQTATSQYYRGKTEKKKKSLSLSSHPHCWLFIVLIFSAFASPFVRNASVLGGFRAAEIQNIKQLQLSSQFKIFDSPKPLLRRQR